MNRLFRIIMTLIIMIISISNGVFSSNLTTENKYCLFYGEIEKKGSVDLGTRYFIQDLNNKKRSEIKNTYLDDGFGGMPVPSIDIKYFTFFTKKGQNQYLNVLDINNNKIEKRVKIPFLSSEVALSKNMQYMTFCRDEIEGDDKREIYLYNNKSDKLTQITTNDCPDYNPVFSPNEDFILYLSEPSLNETILKKYYIKKAITETVKNFSSTGYELTQLAESGLVLMINHNKNGTPFWLNLKTGQTKDINLDRIYFIKATPDGRMLMYHRARKDDDSTWDLFVSDVSGKDSKIISKKDNIDIFGIEWVLPR